MQFKVEVTDRGRLRVIRLAGRLDRSQSADLLRLVQSAPGEVRLELADLVSVDDTGVDTLTALRAGGAELTGPSPYLAFRLRAEVAGGTRPADRSVNTDNPSRRNRSSRSQ